MFGNILGRIKKKKMVSRLIFHIVTGGGGGGGGGGGDGLSNTRVGSANLKTYGWRTRRRVCYPVIGTITLKYTSRSRPPPVVIR